MVEEDGEFEIKQKPMRPVNDYRIPSLMHKVPAEAFDVDEADAPIRNDRNHLY